MMKRALLTVIFFFSNALGVAHADVEINSGNDSSINTSGHHNQVKVNSPVVNDGTDIINTPNAEALAVQGQQQKQRQSTSQSSDQANSQSFTDASQGQQQNHVQSSPVLVMGQAQEGVAIGMPWANASVGKMSEVSRVTSCG